MNPDTTPTPRTDEKIWTTEYHHELCDVVDMEFARKLERELVEKTNEVARLRELLERLCDSVSENWDEGIANYFREEANK